MHLDIKIIILFLEDKLSKEKHVKVLTHLSDCAVCVEQLADIYKLANVIKKTRVPKIDKELKKRVEDIVKKGNVTTSKRIRTNPFNVKIVLTGVFALLIFSVYFFLNNNENVSSKFRDLNKIENFIIVQPQNEALLTGNELIFKWKNVKNSIVYHFVLYKDNGKLLWEKLSKVNSLTLPSSLNMEVNKKYLWKVEVIFPDNSKKLSKLYAFTYKE